MRLPSGDQDGSLFQLFSPFAGEVSWVRVAPCRGEGAMPAQAVRRPSTPRCGAVAHAIEVAAVLFFRGRMMRPQYTALRLCWRHGADGPRALPRGAQVGDLGSGQSASVAQRAQQDELAHLFVGETLVGA